MTKYLYIGSQVVDATQWFKNGDHPDDYAKTSHGYENGELREFSGEHCRAQGWEGQVVRYYRRPDVSGAALCPACGVVADLHGWLDQGAVSQAVCPGDFVVTDGKLRYALRPNVFAALYHES